MRDTCVTHTDSNQADPHAAWEAERQAVAARYDEMATIPGDDLPDDYDDELDALTDDDNTLIRNIKATSPRTIEGALTVIEALDRYHTDMIPTEDPWTVEAIQVRARSVATIRRCLSEREG